MTALAKTLPPLPRRMGQLPISPNGFPVPWFVHIDPTTGPDFRVIGPGKIKTAIAFNRCWLCGQPLGRHKVFCIGPMCAINRITSEPPSHRECAEFAAEACPFLSRPRMRRNEAAAFPSEWDVRPQPGRPAARNPGGVLLWESAGWGRIRAGQGWLIDVGEPVRVDWYIEGRPAGRRAAEQIFVAGAEFLRHDMPEDLPAIERSEGLEALARQVQSAHRFLPPDELGGTWTMP